MVSLFDVVSSCQVWFGSVHFLPELWWKNPPGGPWSNCNSLLRQLMTVASDAGEQFCISFGAYMLSKVKVK